MRVRDLGCIKQALGTKRFSALRLTGVVICACIILGISGCTSKSPTQVALDKISQQQRKASQELAALGTLAWGADDCVYMWVGSWKKQSTCRSYPTPGNTAVFNLYEDYDPQHPTERVDLRDPGWIVIHDYKLILDYKFPNLQSLSPPANQVGVLIFYKGLWLTPPDFELAVKDADEAKHKEARDRAANLLQQLAETKARIMNNIVAPACNSSYNGCR